MQHNDNCVRRRRVADEMPDTSLLHRKPEGTGPLDFALGTRSRLAPADPAKPPSGLRRARRRDHGRSDQSQEGAQMGDAAGVAALTIPSAGHALTEPAANWTTP